MLSESRGQYEAQIKVRERKIESLQLAQSGWLWELLSAYRTAKDRFLATGTRRRILYDRSLDHLKMARHRLRLTGPVFLMVRHPIRTLRNLNRPNINKFFYHAYHSDAAVVRAKLERKLGLDESVVQSVVATVRKFGLIISGCPGDAFRYRCEHQAEQLRLLGLTVDVGYYDQVDFRAARMNYACYWLHRVPHTQVVEDFIRSAQEMGKPVIFDTDDLIFDEDKIPYIRALQWMSQDEVDLYYEGVRRYHRTLSLCRFATVTTEPLREAMQRLFPQIQCFVNPNALSDAQVAQADEALRLSRPPEDENIVRIAYLSGTRTHNIDFQECSGALKRILKAHPCVRLMIVGHLDLEAAFERFDERIERYPLLPWQQLPGLLRKVDINLAPLELDNPFTQSKSALKYFEAAVMNVPTVATDTKAYQSVIRHSENGFLCRSEEDWYNCLTRLVENQEMRRRMADAARKRTLNRLTNRRQVPRMQGILKAMDSAGESHPRKRLSIAFILRAPIAQVGGGYKVIFILANYLARRGYDVHLYVEAIAHLEGKTEAEIEAFCHSHFAKGPAQIHVGHHAIETCDIAVATNWPTAFVVDSLANTRCKIYLVQDFEPDFYEPLSSLYQEAEKTYDLPLRKVTIGRYLADLFSERDQLPVPHFDFGFDTDVFHGFGRKVSGPVRVIFFARPGMKRRGYELGIESLRRLKLEHPDVEICFYGMETEVDLPFRYTNLGVLAQDRLAQAMRDSDIHLSFSLSNISQVPFQAMACGCAVVEAKTRPVEAMVEDGKRCLLARTDPEAVAGALAKLVWDKGLRERIAKNGSEWVRDRTWEKSSEQFEQILLDSLPIECLGVRDHFCSIDSCTQHDNTHNADQRSAKAKVVAFRLPANEQLRTLDTNNSIDPPRFQGLDRPKIPVQDDL